jgi:hypothetical protein
VFANAKRNLPQDHPRGSGTERHARPDLAHALRDGPRRRRYSALGAPTPVELTDSVDPSGSVTDPPLAVFDPSRER